MPFNFRTGRLVYGVHLVECLPFWNCQSRVHCTSFAQVWHFCRWYHSASVNVPSFVLTKPLIFVAFLHEFLFHFSRWQTSLLTRAVHSMSEVWPPSDRILTFNISSRLVYILWKIHVGFFVLKTSSSWTNPEIRWIFFTVENMQQQIKRRLFNATVRETLWQKRLVFIQG